MTYLKDKQEGKDFDLMEVLWWVLYAGVFVFLAWLAVQVLQHWGIV